MKWCLFLILFFCTGSAFAENIDDQLTPELRTIQTEIESEMLSPFCAGRLLKDCPSSAAGDLKREIKRELLAGTPKEQIVKELFNKYGDEYKAVPSSTGFGRVAWLAPVLFLFIGFFLITRLKGHAPDISSATDSDQDNDDSA